MLQTTPTIATDVNVAWSVVRRFMSVHLSHHLHPGKAVEPNEMSRGRENIRVAPVTLH